MEAEREDFDVDPVRDFDLRDDPLDILEATDNFRPKSANSSIFTIVSIVY